MNLYDKNKCFGCGLCAEICPKKCIHMCKDAEGFLIPVCDESICVDCGLCEKKCPANALQKNDRKNQRYYLAWHKDKKILYNSSSGGAFSALAIPVIQSGGAVVGAVYDENFLVLHELVDTLEDLRRIRKSKYLQSDMTSCYLAIDQALKERTVLFTGTPCQCAAIHARFGDHPNLYTCDLICHGVQSPQIFRDSLDYMEKKAGGKCVSLDFRSKKKGWANACGAEVIFDNGKVIRKRANDIAVGSGFLRNLSIRKTCENCIYRTMERAGDITIGDFWAIRDDREMIKKYGDIGYSSIITNNEKGQRLFESAKGSMHWDEKTGAEVQAQNGPLYRQFTPNLLRDRFFQEYTQYGYDAVYERYLKPDYKQILRWHLLKFGRQTGLIKWYAKLRGLLR